MMLIAGILGAWAAYLLIGQGSDNDRPAAGAPQHHAQSAAEESKPEGTSDHQHDGQAEMSVAAMMAAAPDVIDACVGSSLEPYAGAMAQLIDTGPSEAAERMRFCVFETVIGHGNQAIMTDLESHRPHFEQCFGELIPIAPLNKPVAVNHVSTCVLTALPAS